MEIQTYIKEGDAFSASIRMPNSPAICDYTNNQDIARRWAMLRPYMGDERFIAFWDHVHELDHSYVGATPEGDEVDIILNWKGDFPVDISIYEIHDEINSVSKMSVKSLLTEKSKSIEKVNIPKIYAIQYATIFNNKKNYFKRDSHRIHVIDTNDQCYIINTQESEPQQIKILSEYFKKQCIDVGKGFILQEYDHLLDERGMCVGWGTILLSKIVQLDLNEKHPHLTNKIVEIYKSIDTQLRANTSSLKSIVGPYYGFGGKRKTIKRRYRRKHYLENKKRSTVVRTQKAR